MKEIFFSIHSYNEIATNVVVLDKFKTSSFYQRNLMIYFSNKQIESKIESIWYIDAPNCINLRNLCSIW